MVYYTIASIHLFQSLIGLKINWNLIKISALADSLGFQSLIGLKINWNLKFPINGSILSCFNP